MAEPAERDFDVLSARLCEELRPRLSGPYALFGHSMGALLAYGISDRLRESGGMLPTALMVSACAAPSQRMNERFPDEKDAPSLIADLRRHGGTPDELFSNPELLRMTVDLLGADYRICKSFRHCHPPPLPVSIHVFAGREDDISEHRLLAWKHESMTGITLDWFDGGHFFIQRNEASLLDAIAARLKPGGALPLSRRILCA